MTIPPCWMHARKWTMSTPSSSSTHTFFNRHHTSRFVLTYFAVCTFGSQTLSALQGPAPCYSLHGLGLVCMQPQHLKHHCAWNTHVVIFVHVVHVLCEDIFGPCSHATEIMGSCSMVLPGPCFLAGYQYMMQRVYNANSDIYIYNIYMQ